MNDDDRTRIDERNHALVRGLEPRNVFAFFADLSNIPRGSGNTAGVADFLLAFAKGRNLESARDAVGNVIIRKPGQHTTATGGVILQAHTDMVCVMDAGIEHDFSRDPIAFGITEGKLHAAGTTLGADDGIGVALALAVLDDPDMPHPPLEALFTVDEETDMKGAKAVRARDLKGDVLINLDAEDLNVAYISSAAGASSILDIPVGQERETNGVPVFRTIKMRGLSGGHSGIEINKARANAYVLLARFLTALEEKTGYRLYSLEQGEGRIADNAIPARAQAVIGLTSAQDAEAVADLARTWTGIFRNEYRVSDPDVTLEIDAPEQPPSALPLSAPDREKLLAVIRLLPLGINRFVQHRDLMETQYKDLLVETSCNLGGILIRDSSARLTLLSRGSTASALDDLMARLEDLARLTQGALAVTNRTAGWEMPPDPTPVQRLFARQGLACLGVHAGLECGCLVEAFRREGRVLDAISIGPDLKEVHSPRERLNIASVAVLWRQLSNVLAEIG